MLILIIVLSIAGTLALVLEVFLPGGILGIVGGLSILTAIVLTLTAPSLGESAVVTRLAISMAIVTLSVTAFAVTLKYFNRTKLGKLITLESTTAGSPPPSSSDLAVGAEATAASDLSPLGTITVDGRTVDALSESGFVSSGARIRVTRIESGTVYVVES